MNLAVFDLDGTLTRTTGVDDHCYLRAIESALGLSNFDTDWANYPHATDEGLMRDICLRVPALGGLGRDLTDDQAAAVRRQFLALLRDSAERNPGRFEAMPGVPQILHALAATGQWLVAIATGAWRESALIKVAAASLEHLLVGEAALPAAFAGTPAEGGGTAREEIVNLAIARAAAAAGVPRFERTVCIGDGVWDLRTARNLGHGFVGIAEGDRRDRLLCEGAAVVLPHFADLGHALRAITGARTP